MYCTCFYMLLNSRSYHAIPPSESYDSLFAHLAYLAVEHQPVVGLDQPPTHRHQPPGPAPSSPRQYLEEQWGDEEVLHRPAEDACQEPRRRRHQWQEHWLGDEHVENYRAKTEIIDESCGFPARTHPTIPYHGRLQEQESPGTLTFLKGKKFKLVFRCWPVGSRVKDPMSRSLVTFGITHVTLLWRPPSGRAQ